MSATRSVAKNTILLTIGLFSGRVLALFLRKKMTPILGPDGLGILVMALSINTILLTVSRFGLGVLLTREITRAKVLTLPLFWATMRIRWLVSAISYLFIFGFISVAGYDALSREAVLILTLGIFIESAGMACDSVLQAHEKVQYQTAGQIASAVVYFGLGWWWLSAGHGVMGVIWANLASQVARLAVMAPLMLARTGPWTWKDPEGRPVPGLWDMAKLGLPLFLATTFGVIYTKIDIVMLERMISADAAGIYGQGHQAFDVMLLAPGLIGTALFPAMARYGMKDTEDTVRLGERALRFMMIAILPLTLLITFTSEPIIHWFEKGARWNDSIPVMQIVIWGLPLMAAATVFNRLLITADKEKVFVTIGLVSMLVNIALNWFLIPAYSYFGASWATIASMSVSFGLHVFFLNRTDYRPPLSRALIGPPVALGAAWFVTVLLVGVVFPGWGIAWNRLPVDAGWGAFVISTLVTTALYPAALFGLRVLKADDLNLLRQLYRPVQ
ncbi:MAG: flippase [Candidatus Krumholzibacteriota bacterium]